MCILSDTDIVPRLSQFVDPAELELVNPASIDIRIGTNILWQDLMGGWTRFVLHEEPYSLRPGEFVLVETLETLKVPQGYAVELKLKSSIARQGYNHSLAFWFDPGWSGVGTLEIHNVSKTSLPLSYGQRFAQIIIHKLSSPATKLYTGKYQGAVSVESAK